MTKSPKAAKCSSAKPTSPKPKPTASDSEFYMAMVSMYGGKPKASFK